MKKLILVVCFCLLGGAVLSQNYTNKQFALINYDLKITDHFREDIAPLESYINTVKIHNKEADDRLKAILIHHLYYNMTPRLERALEISILPINTFMEEIRYNDFGYPNTSINKALRKGNAPFFFKLEVTLDSQTQEKRKENPDLPSGITLPHFIIDITVYNDEGIISVDKWHGEQAVKQPLKADKRLFSGFVGERELSTDTTLTTLSGLYDQAVTNMINSHLNE